MDILELAKTFSKNNNIKVEEIKCLKINKPNCNLTFLNANKLINLRKIYIYNAASIDLHNIDKFSNLEEIRIYKKTAILNVSALEKRNKIKLYLDSNDLDIMSKSYPYENIYGINLLLSNIKSLDRLENFYNLRELNLDGTFINSLNGIEKCPELKKLSLSCTKIKSLEKIKYLKQIEILDLSSTSISSISPLSSLSHINELNLKYVKISNFSPLQELVNLKKLVLRSTNIKSVLELKNLKKLEYLDLSNTNITNIEYLKDLKELKHLNLSNTKILSIKPIEDLLNLEILNLSNTQVRDISFLKKLNKIRILDLKNTPIESIDVFENLSSIQLLDISNSKISNLQPLDSLINLKLLNICDTKVDKFSVNLINRKPKYFNQYLDNDITWIGYKNSNKFKIYCKNAFPYIETLLLFKSENSAKQYMLELFDDNAKSKYLKEARVILLGAGEAGKTSLIKSFSNEYVDGIDSTRGIDITHKKILCDNEEFELHFWDLGGQEVYHPLHTLFMSSNSIYVIVLNGRNDEKPDEWLDYINTFAPNAYIIIVINKLDQNPRACINNSYYISTNKNIYNNILKYLVRKMKWVLRLLKMFWMP